MARGQEPGTPKREIAIGMPDWDDLRPAPWAANLVALGARMARTVARPKSRLVVVVSVPVRDFCAALMATGWVMTQQAPQAVDPTQLIGELPPHSLIRFLVADRLVAGQYNGSSQSGSSLRMNVDGSWWPLERVKAIWLAPQLSDTGHGKVRVPGGGSLVAAAQTTDTWRSLLGAGHESVVIVGTLTRLIQDLETRIGFGECVDGSVPADGASGLGDILWPDTAHTVTSLTRLVPATSDEDTDKLAGVGLTILDGPTATGWIDLVAPSSHTVVVLDRSAADQSTEELLLERRSRSQPRVVTDLGWRPYAGIEALAFEEPR